jgi:hypothetical protein
MTQPVREPAPDGTAAPPVVPGFAVQRLLGRGGQGRVWLATDLSSGEDVALKIAASGTAGTTSDADLAWEREVALLRRIDHPHVVRLRRVATLAGGGRALVLDVARGGSLTALVRRRARLDPCEVTTVLVPLARALAHLHQRGLVHGDISPGNVLFGVDGRPMLSDLGAARVLGLGEREVWVAPGFDDPSGAAACDPARDVWGLGAVGWFALTGRAPGPAAGAGEALPAGAPSALVGLLTDCLGPDPAARPGPAEVATRAWAATRPAPIRLLYPTDEPDAADAGASAVTRRVRLEAARAGARQVQAGRSRRLTMRIAVASVAFCGCAFLAVMLSGRGGAEPIRPAGAQAAPVAGRPDVAAAVEAFGRARAQAFAGPSVRPLAEVDEPGSPAMAADARLVALLSRQGVQLRGLSFRVRDVRQVSRAGTGVTLTATVTTSAHRQVARGGRHRAVQVSAAPARTVRLTLVRSRSSAHGWLVRAVA